MSAKKTYICRQYGQEARLARERFSVVLAQTLGILHLTSSGESLDIRHVTATIIN